MSSLNGSDRRKLEKLFSMDGGYVLNFSDRTFHNFFDEHGVDIDADCYKVTGTSKAKRMRTFWQINEDYIVGRIISALISYSKEEDCLPADTDPILIDDCNQISQRLLNNQVAELDSLTAITDEHSFEMLVNDIRKAIEKNQPESALDRLHTFVMKFIRTICKSHGINVDQSKPLHSIFGGYVRALRDNNYLESIMTERILKSSISVLEAFNDVRNDKSLAHDNPILNREESLLICNHVTALVRFIKQLETKIQAAITESKNKIDDALEKQP